MSVIMALLHPTWFWGFIAHSFHFHPACAISLSTSLCATGFSAFLFLVCPAGSTLASVLGCVGSVSWVYVPSSYTSSLCLTGSWLVLTHSALLLLVSIAVVFSNLSSALVHKTLDLLQHVFSNILSQHIFKPYIRTASTFQLQMCTFVDRDISLDFHILLSTM